MSKTRIVQITLDQLVERSSYIVVAEPDLPPSRREEVAVVYQGNTYEPYQRWLDSYRVLESLRGDLKKGVRIEVQLYNDPSLEHMHRLYVIEGGTKSYYDQCYEPTATVTSGGPFVLFLNRSETRYAYVTSQSVEGLGARREIERLLKRTSP